jgi:OOP family OmpA-OmpF porin
MRLHFSSLLCSSATLLAVTALSSLTRAQDADASVSAAATPMTLSTSATLSGDDDDDDVMAPRGNLFELGIFGGLLWISERNAFHEPALPFANFENPSPELGLRMAYLPLSFLGLEGEFMAGAAELEGGEGATPWAGRGHLILQIPTRSVSPFVLAGGGRMGIFSDSSGDDNDPSLHFGGGLKINVHRKVAIRLDVRDSITKERPESDTAHHIEALAGLSLVFGRPAPRPKDSDGDRVIDLQDACPLEPGLPPDGCPIRDADSDGILDPDDQCPTEAGIAPTGCPVRDADADGVPDEQDECRDVPGIQPTGCPDQDADGILDRDDQCLDVAGIAPHGCPPDSDGDGFIDSKDKCPNEAENKNGFEDDDGCPDTIPEQVKKFTGVIKGIEFETGKAEIRAMSRPLLDEAAGVLNQHPSLKVMIVGHTDNVGTRDKNVDLSRRRAEAVKTFLMERGVDAERVLTRGEGPDMPVADNKTRAGRQQNRRIEFQIVQ